jgi:hypothetical protein
VKHWWGRKNAQVEQQSHLDLGKEVLALCAIDTVPDTWDVSDSPPTDKVRDGNTIKTRTSDSHSSAIFLRVSTSPEPMWGMTTPGLCQRGGPS